MTLTVPLWGVNQSWATDGRGGGCHERDHTQQALQISGWCFEWVKKKYPLLFLYTVLLTGLSFSIKGMKFVTWGQESMGNGSLCQYHDWSLVQMRGRGWWQSLEPSPLRPLVGGARKMAISQQHRYSARISLCICTIWTHVVCIVGNHEMEQCRRKSVGGAASTEKEISGWDFRNRLKSPSIQRFTSSA